VANPEITVCGRLTVAWDGEQLEEKLPGRQGRLIFAYLVLNRSRPVRRDELVEALWADEGLPSGGESLLAPPLSRLRKALGQDRLQGRTDLSLNIGDEAMIDCELAQEKLASAQASTGARADREQLSDAWRDAQVAAGIFEGGLLPGLEARWIDEHRAYFEELRLKSLETVARIGARLGTAEQARAEGAARNAVEASPFRESARAALIEVLEAQGNIAEALRAYEELRLLLRDELGTFPAPELSAIHERLLNAHESGTQTPDPVPSAKPAPTAKAIGLEIDPRIDEVFMVGRDRILEQLKSELDLAAAGELRIALLAGEGGVGKTRLAAELAASREDIVTLYGRAEPDEVRPFSIWSGLLRSAIRQVGDIEPAEIVGGDGPTLARLLPELARRMNLPAPGPTSDLESERQALYGAVMRMIGRFSARQPMLIVLDDLHWADRSTLRLLASLAGDNPPKGILALGIYRDTELSAESQLPETLSQLQRRLPTTRLLVESLSEEEVRNLISGRLDENLAPVIRDQTGGNPFFIEQLVRNLEESGDARPSTVPPEIREVISQRVARLPDGGPEILGRAALIGRDFDLSILARTTADDEDRIIELLDAAVVAGLLNESGSVPGRYSFVHALVMSTMGESLSLTRRAAIHRRIGEAIEQRSQNQSGQQRDRALPILASHFNQAGPAEADRAIHYGTLAARQAEERLANDEAVGFYNGAIAACRADEPVDQGLLAELLLSRAGAEWRMGQLPQSGVTFVEATEAARESGFPELFARAANGVSWGSWETFDNVRDTPISLLTEALELLDKEDSSLLAETMANLSHLKFFSGDPDDDATEMSRHALEMADRIGDDAFFKAAVSLHYYLLQSTTPEYRRETADRLVRIAEESEDREDLAEALAMRVVMLTKSGRGAESAADIARHGALAKTLPQVRNTNSSLQASRHFMEGRWAEGERITEEALASEHMSPSSRIAMIDALHYMDYAQRGKLGEVIPILELEVQVAAAWNTWPAWEVGLALGYLQAGDREKAVRQLETVDFEKTKAITRMELIKPVFCGVSSLITVELNDPVRAKVVSDLVEELTDVWTIFGPAAPSFGPHTLLLGEMYLVQERFREAATALENSIIACESMNARPFLARSQVALAEALSRLNDPDGQKRTTELRESGLAIAKDLEMAAVLARYE
jgi:DNA-binding SARP family transcriptional activator